MFIEKLGIHTKITAEYKLVALALGRGKKHPRSWDEVISIHFVIVISHKI